ncbi:MAG: EAL domain-containing protein [Campylobacterales bacterium]|nr:EAL domain-containing protein [Campylobacterales bacterium]
MKNIRDTLSINDKSITITNKYITDELYHFVPKIDLTLFILSIVFLYFFWTSLENHAVVMGWFILTQILILSKIHDFVQYNQKEKRTHPPFFSWYQKFHIKSLLNAMLWGLLPILFLNELNGYSQFFLILLIVGFAGGVAGFLPDFRIAFPSITILLVPLIVKIHFLDDFEHGVVLQCLLLIFYALLILSNRRLNHLNQQIYHNRVRYESANERLTRKENKLKSLLDQAPIGIFYYDTHLKIINYNKPFQKILGVDKDLTGFDLNKLKDKKALKVMEEVLINHVKQESFGSYNFSYQDETIWVELACSPITEKNGVVRGGIGIVENKTIEHQAYEQINYISLHDSLTQLPNRRYYINFMQDLIHSDKNQTHYSALLYMDLNRFKQINDTFGHLIGDKLLLDVAKRFDSMKIKHSFLSRLGGDEFIMVLPFISDNPAITEAEAAEVAGRIKEMLHHVFEIEGLNLYMTTSIGIVIIEPKTDDIDSIIRQADMAMYQTKREGQDNISFYDKQLDLEQQELTSLQQDLNHAIKNNELALHYQPIVHISNDKLIAVEALVRWGHPTKGLIMPDQFIPMATDSGLINKVGWWVVNEVCRQLTEWKAKDLINFEYVAININARQLHEVNFSEHIEKCILKYNIDPSLIKLEVTETTLIDSFSKTQQIVKDLRSRGVECSIDDFGTGYSSLSYLKKLSFKVLKIDQVFIADILHNRDDQELVKSIIGIGKQFHYNIIVEGIETEEQKQKILEISKDVSYQGYLCSRPIPPKDFEERFL